MFILDYSALISRKIYNFWSENCCISKCWNDHYDRSIGHC